MATVSDLVKEMGKSYGKDIVTKGVPAFSYDRAPTGFFDFDLGTGGGFPRGKASIVYGPEGSGKTTLVLKAIAQHQKNHPEQKCVFVDIEGHYDPEWGSKLGIDNNALIYCMPESAEQTVDIVEAFLHADDVGMVGVDSLAAMISNNEQQSSADKMVVGGTGLIIGRLYRKCTKALNDARRAGRFPTLVCINQIRFKIGVTHGDPETMPGGKSVMFFASLIVRVYGKDENEPKVNKDLPAWKVISCIVKKKKIATISREFTVKMAIIPGTGIAVGSSYDWPTITRFLKEYGMLYKDEKASGGWWLEGINYKLQDDIKDKLQTDNEFANTIKNKIFNMAIKSTLEVDMEDGTVIDDNEEIANAL